MGTVLRWVLGCTVSSVRYPATIGLVSRVRSTACVCIPLYYVHGPVRVAWTHCRVRSRIVARKRTARPLRPSGPRRMPLLMHETSRIGRHVDRRAEDRQTAGRRQTDSRQQADRRQTADRQTDTDLDTCWADASTRPGQRPDAYLGAWTSQTAPASRCGHGNTGGLSGPPVRMHVCLELLLTAACSVAGELRALTAAQHSVPPGCLEGTP